MVPTLTRGASNVTMSTLSRALARERAAKERAECED